MIRDILANATIGVPLLAMVVYCGIKTAADFRSRRTAMALFGAFCVLIALAGVGLMAKGLSDDARF